MIRPTSRGRVRDVATVLARLTGADIRLNTDQVLIAKVTSLRLEAMNDMPQCVAIRWLDGQSQARWALYHFEFDEHGNHGLIFRSTPEAIALGRGLVDFFGGAVDYSDHDDSNVDYVQPARPDIHAEDGDEWDDFQRRLAGVTPLTEADIKACRGFAAYC